jgi:NADH:ubiquinone oxidoreductase subunit 2 (subunit N)
VGILPALIAIRTYARVARNLVFAQKTRDSLQQQPQKPALFSLVSLVLIRKSPY